MPHILIRYFSVRNEKEMKKSKIIGSTWILIILGAASFVGLLGRSFFGEKLEKAGTQDLVFVNMIRDVFAWIGNNTGVVTLCVFLAGILLSAILAASMSTADSQLLASSSAFVSDIYRPVFRKNATDKEMMWAGRIIIILISVVAFLIASNPKCGGIMALVSCAWGAFGAAFGPVILLSLFWNRLNYHGALAGIIAGFAVDIVWYLKLSSLTGIYEIVPGFIAGLAVAYLVSLATKAPGAEVLELFEKAKAKTE
jgi:sodium/proline symporter